MYRTVFFNALTILFFAQMLCVHASAFAQLLDSITLAGVREYTSLEEALDEPGKVYKLILKHKRYDAFPVEILEFKYLQLLDLSKNRIAHIPVEIGKLQYLQDLDLSKNRIETLPNEICNLKHLKYLRLGQNELWSLPDCIGNLQDLVYLDLWSNNMTELPESISELRKLKLLDMRVIQLNEREQGAIKALLPDTKVHFSSPCACDH